MKIHVDALGRSFDVPCHQLAPYTQTEMVRALPALRGRKLAVDFQKDIDGPQTAARLVKETLGNVGVSWVVRPSSSEAFIWIQGASGHLRFAFVVADPSGNAEHVAAECGPRELTATIMTAICEYFSNRTSNDEISATDEVDRILGRVRELNRQITGASLAKDLTRAGNLMTELTECVRQLGHAGGQRVVKPICDALADSAVAYDVTGLDQARAVSQAAIAALQDIGPAAVPTIKQHTKDARSAVAQAFSDALRACSGKKWWEFWR